MQIFVGIMGQQQASLRATVLTCYHWTENYMINYIYIWQLWCGVISWSKFRGVSIVINWSKFVFLTLFVNKHYKIWGFGTFLIQKITHTNLIVINWSKLAFLWTPNLDQLITLRYLDQLITIKNGHCLLFLLLKMCWNTYFYSAFWTSANICPQKAINTITFHIFQNTGS